MFPDNVSQNIDVLVVINVWKNNFGFHSNHKTQGQKHRVNNLYFKYQVCQTKIRHLNTFLQFKLLFHKPHCKQRAMFLEMQIFTFKERLRISREMIFQICCLCATRLSLEDIFIAVLSCFLDSLTGNEMPPDVTSMSSSTSGGRGAPALVEDAQPGWFLQHHHPSATHHPPSVRPNFPGKALGSSFFVWFACALSI